MTLPLVNYCRKCKAEVPSGEACPRCFGKLTKSGERLSFGMLRAPVRDWFAWNQVLRIALPALGIVMGLTLGIEAAVSGERGIQALFLQGFLGVLLGALGLMLLFMLVLLTLQGKEALRVVMDREGIHAYTYLARPTTLRLYARFLTWAAVEAMQKEELHMEGYVLVSRVELLWSDIRRVRFWREDRRILLYKPAWWQALAVRCPAGEYGEAEAMIRKKLGRSKKVRLIPKKG